MGAGADPAQTNKAGQTPAQYAAAQKHPEVAKYLATVPASAK